MVERTPKLGRVCVTVTGSRLAELRASALREGRRFGFVELRLDYLDPAELTSPGISKLVRDLKTRKVSAIATLRSVAGGGKYQGSVEEQVRLLAATGASLVDLEVESASQLTAESLARLRDQVKLMVSFHDYQQTPPGLGSSLDRLRRFPADLYKLVTVAHSQEDNAALLDLLNGANGKLVAFTMGEIGMPTRVMCLAAGAPFTYAAASNTGVVGIGQIPAEVMESRYRAPRITTRTRVIGVAGRPIAHSLSPVIHNAAFAKLRTDAVYVPFDVGDFDAFWSAFKSRISGLSITMPHKEAAARVADVRHRLAEKAGASNTLVKTGKRWKAYNTDVIGIIGPLAARIQLRGARVLVAGAGGAARAAVFALADAGCRVSVVSRTPERAATLAAEFGAESIAREDVSRHEFDVILHATPLGMTPDTATCFFHESELNAGILFETVYTPQVTPLIRMAKKRGLEVITGVEMFLTQAMEQFRLWTGKKAPEKVMETALRAALPKGD